MNGGTRCSALEASVLVLNRFYMAVHVVNVRRALGLLYRDLAEVVHIEDGCIVREERGGAALKKDEGCCTIHDHAEKHDGVQD